MIFSPLLWHVFFYSYLAVFALILPTFILSFYLSFFRFLSLFFLFLLHSTSFSLPLFPFSPSVDSPPRWGYFPIYIDVKICNSPSTFITEIFPPSVINTNLLVTTCPAFIFAAFCKYFTVLTSILLFKRLLATFLKSLSLFLVLLMHLFSQLILADILVGAS